jgi:M6 family metalloprotease-like protein
MMNKPLWLFIILLIVTIPISAAYLTNLPKTITQPDGSAYKVFASGDEYHNWLHDAQGYTIIQNKTTGYYTYAKKVGTKVEPSEYIVGKIDPQASGLSLNVNIDPEEYKQIRHRRWDGVNRNLRSPTSGNVNNLVVFIRFSDETEFTGSFASYSSMFNNNVPNTNSMYNYFKEDSYQALSISTYFYPEPANDIIVSYQDSLPRNYYEPYSAQNTTGYNGDYEREEREMHLLQNAVNFIATMVPVELDLDADDDGLVDNVCFVVRGATGEWADLLWPHMWVMQNHVALINGAQVYTFNFQLEDALLDSGVGVLCHEMSHSMGFPDLYHYSYDGFTTVGRWDLMENNRNPPQHHCAYMKSRYTDWLPPMQELTQSGTYWVNKMLIREGNCYKIASNNPQYYYVVEFRKKQGFFENSLPGTGLLVYRVNTSEDGNGNADGPPDELYVYRPNGTTTVNGSTMNAHFSLEVNRTAINETTNPTPFLADGSQGGLNITQIGSSIADSISFLLELPAPPPTDYDEGFETGDFSFLPWSFEADAGWTIDSTEAYAGVFSAKSGLIGHNQTSSMLAIIDVPADGNLGFVKKVSSEQGYDYLRFYIDGVQMAQWSGNSNWSYVQYPVTAGVHIFKWSYVKDQGVVSGSDCVWIDNISFRWDAPDLFFPPQGFQALSVFEDVAITLNWNIPNSSTAILSGYRVFRDDVQIADIDTSQLSFWDFNVVPNNNYSYYVKSIYNAPHGHSISTDTLTVTVTSVPIIPVLLAAEIIDTNSVHLQWMLPDLVRGVIGFQIYRNGGLLQSIDSVSVTDWIDDDLPNGQYSYQVAAQYPAFTSDLSAPISITISVGVNNNDPLTAPLVFGISKCYPNPFRQDTTIRYCLDKDNQPYELSIYNIKGQKVKTLNTGKTKAGTYDVIWNGTNDNGDFVASGIYYCRIQNSQHTAFQRLLLLK